MSGLVGNSQRHVLSCRGSHIYMINRFYCTSDTKLNVRSVHQYCNGNVKYLQTSNCSGGCRGGSAGLLEPPFDSQIISFSLGIILRKVGLIDLNETP